MPRSPSPWAWHHFGAKSSRGIQGACTMPIVAEYKVLGGTLKPHVSEGVCYNANTRVQKRTSNTTKNKNKNKGWKPPKQGGVHQGKAHPKLQFGPSSPR
mmetsp:Transcript_45487/g.81386  ORF Transcript_45487/g.81386 Transcript_45487/m.81386 type:complete len:99 (+) Transcript_45487:1827-2123(+)